MMKFSHFLSYQLNESVSFHRNLLYSSFFPANSKNRVVLEKKNRVVWEKTEWFWKEEAETETASKYGAY